MVWKKKIRINEMKEFPLKLFDLIMEWIFSIFFFFKRKIVTIIENLHGFLSFRFIGETLGWNGYGMTPKTFNSLQRRLSFCSVTVSSPPRSHSFESRLHTVSRRSFKALYWFSPKDKSGTVEVTEQKLYLRCSVNFYLTSPLS